MHLERRKFLVAVLLALCVGAQLVELSSRWDRTIQDANDEAGVVAVVLCIGAALFAAGTLLTRIRSRLVSRIIPPSLRPERDADPRTILPILLNRPSASLRI
jgi:hypothetical protein